VTFPKELFFYGQELLVPRPSPKLEDHPLIGCLRLLIQYICSYPPYLKALSSILNLTTCHAVVTGAHQQGVDESIWT